jgi:protein O-GlcNAc transferase
MNLLSFALWGSTARYTVGAIRNAELAAAVYPGWICRFYCGSSVPAATLRTLADLPHVQVVAVPEPGDWRALFWRFRPAGEADVEVMCSRDTDSRLGVRERAAVDAWLASDRDVHVMRDHPLHRTSILGGLWGVRAGCLGDIDALVAAYPVRDVYDVDQRFLEEVVAPRVRDRWLEHDGYFARKPFPTRRAGREFVGQPFDEHDRPLIEGPSRLEERLAAMLFRQGPVVRLAGGARRLARRALGR